MQASISALEVTGKYYAAICMDIQDRPRFGGIQVQTCCVQTRYLYLSPAPVPSP